MFKWLRRFFGMSRRTPIPLGWAFLVKKHRPDIYAKAKGKTLKEAAHIFGAELGIPMRDNMPVTEFDAAVRRALR